MKLKHTLFFISFILVGTLFSQVYAQATSLEIKKTNDSDLKINLNILQKITFSGSDLVLNYNSGTNENIPLDDILKMNFGIISAVVTPTQNNNLFAVYPNPATDYLFFKTPISELTCIKVYSINGIEVLNETLTANQQMLKIGQLDKGLYFIKVNNQVSKFTKR